MSDRRPFPPSPRRLALARASGLSAASPIVVGAAAAGAAALALVELGTSAATRLGTWVAHACAGADGAALRGGTPGAAAGPTPAPSLAGSAASAAPGLDSTASAAHGGLAAASPTAIL